MNAMRTLILVLGAGSGAFIAWANTSDAAPACGRCSSEWCVRSPRSDSTCRRECDGRFCYCASSSGCVGI